MLLKRTILQVASRPARRVHLASLVKIDLQGIRAVPVSAEETANVNAFVGIERDVKI
jgi:hypothetical protein